MGLLPTTLGIRPRLAVEIRPEGVLAARAEDADALLAGIAFGPLAAGAVAPGLKPGNLPERASVIAAIKKALETVMVKERETSLVLPDAAVRVLFLDFDELSAKPAEALSVVRFRLKKLLPFDADDAAVTFQIMSSARGNVRVLAVAIPRDVLGEYESVVREAGFEPGAVLPSTLAALGSLDPESEATLIVNADANSVTTAIVQQESLLLHRMVNFAAEGIDIRPDLEVPVSREVPAELLALPLVDPHDTATEWTMQQPLKGYGMIDDDPIATLAAEHTRNLQRQSVASVHEPVTPLHRQPSAFTREIAQAVSVASAYFEDTLQRSPDVLLCAGSLDATSVSEMLEHAGLQNLRVQEIVEPAMRGEGASTSRIPLGWLAGVRGALKS